MLSKILISFDYEQLTPFIKIEYHHSEDERDKMVGKFLEAMGGDVCFTKFQYETNYETKTFTTAGIRPIPFVNLREEVKTMQVWIDHLEKNVLKDPKKK